MIFSRVFVIASAVVVLPRGLGSCIASIIAIVLLVPLFVGSVWLIGVVWVVVWVGRALRGSTRWVRSRWRWRVGMVEFVYMPVP